MRRSAIVVLAVLLVLLALRAVLPIAVERYANRVLDRAEGYRGSIGDVDLAFILGRYQIEDLELIQLDEDVERPLLKVDSLGLSIEWGALLQGAMVADVLVDGAIYTIEAAPPSDSEALDQTGEEVDWIERLDELLPLRINRLELRNGTFVYRDPHHDPVVSLRIDELSAEGKNWGNVRDREQKRYATLAMRGNVFDSGELRVGLKADPLARKPDFSLDLRARQVSLPEINPSLRAYAGFDASEGRLDVFSEIDARGGSFHGYIKPLIHDLEVLEDDSESVVTDVWEGFIAGLAEALENQPEDQQGARVPVEGDFGQPDLSIWAAVSSVLSNAFLEALPMGLEQTGG